MEKIININLAGSVIAIEDSAYTRLKAYLESLHTYFAAEEGRDEIISDIESRIAELMADKIKRGSLAITDDDIAGIIAGMGSVEDFAAADSDKGTANETGGHNSYGSAGKARRHFYRDSNDRIVGGVCSGLAAYLNVDPALVRIVFAILALGGWGTGLLLYIALWIIVPAAELNAYRGRRLFRSADDKWIGGVCSGLAAYFDKDALIFRAVFAIPLLLSIFSGSFHLFHHTSLFFGSFFSTFVLIYIVLWIVLPLASSEFEKMEMRGEKVDLASIRQNVYSGMDDLKSRAKSLGKEAGESASRFMNTRGRQFVNEATAAARPVASRGGHIIGILLRAFLLFIAGSVACSLFAALIAYCFSGASVFVNDFILRNPEQRWLSWVAVILFLGIPMIAIITWIIRRIMKIKSRNSYLGWTFAGLWMIGAICLIVFGVSLASDFSHANKATSAIKMMQPKNGRLIVKVTEPAIEFQNSFGWFRDDDRIMNITLDTMYSNSIRVIATLSPDSQYHTSLRRYSRGLTAADAASHAQDIMYSAGSGNDSELLLGAGFAISKSQKYRGQNVVVEVQVPAGKKIRFDESVDERLDGVLLNFPRHHSFRHHRNIEDDWNERYAIQDWETNIDYVMSSNGELMNPDVVMESKKGIAQTDTLAPRARDRRLDSLDRVLNSLQKQKSVLEDSEE